MTEAEQPAIRITTASRTFKGHEGCIAAAAVFPDRRRMVTASDDKTLRLWHLEDGVLLKIMEGHRFSVISVAVSRDGQFIASGDVGGEVIAWNRDGESLIEPIKNHTKRVWWLDFSPDSTVLASGSCDGTELWNTKTWQVQGDPLNCGAEIFSVRYSPSGECLAIATFQNIQIWNPGKRECITKFQGHSAFNRALNISLVWTPDGKQLVSGGSTLDPTIRIWDSSTWKQVGEPWKGHTGSVMMIALNPTGTLLASASQDHQVRLWRLSDQRTIAILKHTNGVGCVTFSTDGKHILSGGNDKVISKWAVPLPKDILQDHASHASFVHFPSLFHLIFFKDVLREDASKEQVADNVCSYFFCLSCILIPNFDAKVQQSDCEAGFQPSLLPHNLIIHDADSHHQHDSPRCMHKQRLAHCREVVDARYWRRWQRLQLLCESLVCKSKKFKLGLRT
jgi:WD40 repeat protein